MEAKNATTQDFPATLAFDPENAVLAGAGNGWFAAIACDSTLHRGGVGAEIARRWNAHEALLAALERATRAFAVVFDETQNPEMGAIEVEFRALIARARGA